MKKMLYAALILMLLLLSACGNQEAGNGSSEGDSPEDTESKEVNLYTARHYDVDEDRKSVV